MGYSSDGGWGVLCTALFVLAAGCSFGDGDGQLSGSIAVEDCYTGSYSLNPNFFGAQPVEELLEIRVQRGSGNENVVDGIFVLVRDAERMQNEQLGQALEVNNADGPVGVTLYLNKTCSPEKDRAPVVLPAVSGTVVFESIYAPESESSDVRIAATLDGIRFMDPRTSNRSAELSGYFDFLFQRGSPAQRFP